MLFLILFQHADMVLHSYLLQLHNLKYFTTDASYASHFMEDQTQDQYWQAKNIYILKSSVLPSSPIPAPTQLPKYLQVCNQLLARPFRTVVQSINQWGKRSLSSFVTCLNALQCVDSDYDFYGIFTFNHLNFNEQTLLKPMSTSSSDTGCVCNLETCMI